MDFSLFGLLSWYLVFVFSLVAHEAAHSYAAWKLGDPTAHRGGQVTLDPFPHIARSPVGTVVVPLITYFNNGWMIGWASAPYDPAWAQQYPRRHALMALAGPASNGAIVILALLVMKIGLASGWFALPFDQDASHLIVARQANWLYVAARLLSIACYLNVILFVFNLIPLPPLDGWSVLKAALPAPLLTLHRDASRQGIFQLGGLLVAWFLFPSIGRPLLGLVKNLLAA